jgi:hypothetical protein
MVCGVGGGDGVVLSLWLTVMTMHPYAISERVLAPIPGKKLAGIIDCAGCLSWLMEFRGRDVMTL